MKTVIVGKNSNFSNALAERIDDAILLSSRDILEGRANLSDFGGEPLNIIINAFWPATRLNDLSDLKGYIDSALTISAKVLDQVRACQVNKLIYTSSASVYGNNSRCKESDVLSPLSLHASLKVANERLIEQYCGEHNINFTIARLFNLYGGNDSFSVISKILDAIRENRAVTIINDGSGIRDFVYIEDAVSVYLALLEKTAPSIVNVASGHGTSVGLILEHLKIHGIHVDTNALQRDEIISSIASMESIKRLIDTEGFMRVESYILSEVEKTRLLDFHKE